MVRRLKWLARIPGAPQVFDAALLASTALCHPARLKAIGAIEAAVAQWPGMRVRVHRFGGLGFFLHDAESSHIHGNGLLDSFVGRQKRDALISDGRALPHHLFPRSGWISYWVEDEGDVNAALELIRLAASRQPST